MFSTGLTAQRPQARQVQLSLLADVPLAAVRDPMPYICQPIPSLLYPAPLRPPLLPRQLQSHGNAVWVVNGRGEPF